MTTTDVTTLAPPYPVYLQPNQTSGAITARIVARLQSTNLDLSEGSWEMDWINLCVQELVLLPDALWRSLKASFMLYPECRGVLVDYRAAEENVSRTTATRATTTLRFTAAAGTYIPANTQVGAPTSAVGLAPVLFATQIAATVGTGLTTVDVTAVCATAGPSGNLPAGALTLLVDPTVFGVPVQVTNPVPSAGGLPAESDDSLKNRYFDVIRNRGTSGNPAQWRQWALSVNGVGNAAVVRTPSGAGSVGVSLLGTDNLPASSTVVQAVKDYIIGTTGVPGVASIGPTDIQIYAAPSVTVNVSATVTYVTGANVANVRAAIQTNLIAYFASLNFDPADNNIHPDRVGAVIGGTPGVAYYDIATLHVAGLTTIVQIPDDSVAVLGTLTV